MLIQSLVATCMFLSAPAGEHAGHAAPPWVEAEKDTLRNHVQITFPDRFLKAGESYFSPDDQRIVFQAIEVGAEGEGAEDFYAMYVADVVRNASTGRITGIDKIRRISPEGSANTCGWFHPTDPNIVLFASTVTSPTESQPPGYQRGSGRYRWMFPPEMDIVQVDLRRIDGTPDSLTVVLSNREAYIAECSLSPDGRHLLYCSLESNQGDLFVKDLRTGKTTRIVEAQGYDGGPFFSPDGRRICYRSDRTGTNLLQLYIGELAFNADGAIIGLKREYQITDNEHVNWAPFWHPHGRHLVYATSEVSHRRYEVFIIDADPGYGEGSRGSVKYGTRKRRVTNAEGFDGLPVFDSTGKIMMWTSQRGEGGSSQLWVADFVMPLDPVIVPSAGR
ncbi:MAG TPA: hypothetical protein PK098_11505 [Phycisphaerales bacterium]|nr:hypothetical protein [Phycisphaerales bacterium]